MLLWMVSLIEFVEALDAESGDDAVTAETWLWKDLRIAGDDWDNLVVCVLKRLGSEATTDINIYNYIPSEGEVGLFGRQVGNRSIPDIRVRELYAFIDFDTHH